MDIRQKTPTCSNSATTIQSWVLHCNKYLLSCILTSTKFHETNYQFVTVYHIKPNELKYPLLLGTNHCLRNSTYGFEAG